MASITSVLVVASFTHYVDIISDVSASFVQHSLHAACIDCWAKTLCMAPLGMYTAISQHDVHSRQLLGTMLEQLVGLPATTSFTLSSRRILESQHASARNAQQDWFKTAQRHHSKLHGTINLDAASLLPLSE